VSATEPSSQGSTALLNHIYRILAAGLALVLPGLLALWSHKLLLFASLGPTAVMMAQQPTLRTSHWYNAFAGHALGMLSAFITVWLLALATAPSVFVVDEVSPRRVAAAALSVALALLLEQPARAQHPPAASTTLLVALGSFKPTWHDAGVILGGVAAVIVAGELLKGLRTLPH